MTVSNRTLFAAGILLVVSALLPAIAPAGFASAGLSAVARLLLAAAIVIAARGLRPDESIVGRSPAAVGVMTAWAVTAAVSVVLMAAPVALAADVVDWGAWAAWLGVASAAISVTAVVLAVIATIQVLRKAPGSLPTWVRAMPLIAVLVSVAVSAFVNLLSMVVVSAGSNAAATVLPALSVVMIVVSLAPLAVGASFVAVAVRRDDHSSAGREPLGHDGEVVSPRSGEAGCPR